jgi:NO-binding membrane sensor protein with MHYT domain
MILPEIHHFTFGALTPGLAYAMSCAGSLLGLLCTTRARLLDGSAQARWLMFGALAIGGTGIWVMHFIAMLGFSISGTTIRYDIPLTLLSAVIAIVVVGFGLLIVGLRALTAPTLLLSGVITGAGVAAMHYTGMAAMHTNIHIHYDAATVAISVLIAVGAATAALWAALRVRGGWATTGAALIMGVAVSSMHYTGMSAMSVGGTPSSSSAVPPGASPLGFLAPLIVGIAVSTICLLTAVAVAPSQREMQAETELMDRIRRRQSQPPIWLDTINRSALNNDTSDLPPGDLPGRS